MPATPSPRPVFATEDLPWGLLSSARVQGDAQVLETLWCDYKRPEQARASAVRAIFAGACAHGDTALAAWVQNLHPQHIDVKTLKDTAMQAIKDGSTPVWNFLTDAIDTHHGAANIYSGLLRTAAEHGTPAILQKIWPHAGDTPSAQLYAAVIGDNMPALEWLMGACKKENKLDAVQVDKAFLLAIQRAQTPMASRFLAVGADASTHDDAALRQALPHSAADGGILMEMLVRAGAHPQKAQDLLATLPETQTLMPKIKQAAEETAQRHLTALHAACGQPPLLSAHQDTLGMSGIHYAAQHRILDRIPVQNFTAADMLRTNVAGENVVQVLVRRGAEEAFFAPARWHGQTEKLAAVLDLLPDGHWPDVKRAQILRTAEQQTLQHMAASAAGAFRLGQRPNS